MFDCLFGCGVLECRCFLFMLCGVLLFSWFGDVLCCCVVVLSFSCHACVVFLWLDCVVVLLLCCLGVLLLCCGVV